MIIESIFPSPIGIFNLGRDLSNDEVSFLSSLEKEQSLFNSSSQNRYVLKNDALNSLTTFIDESILQYFKTIYDPKSEVSPYITQSWVNFNDRGQSHHLHNHSNSFISGVFYIQIDQDDGIIFHNLENKPLVISPNVYNTFNSLSWKIIVKNWDLILFPSALFHSVNPNINNQCRISLSFNTYLKGTVGDSRFSNELVF